MVLFCFMEQVVVVAVGGALGWFFSKGICATAGFEMETWSKWL
jgi:hypothetical protein